VTSGPIVRALRKNIAAACGRDFSFWQDNQKLAKVILKRGSYTNYWIDTVLHFHSIISEINWP
jgi:hypothetical protein